jgi:hypothetical protein
VKGLTTIDKVLKVEEEITSNYFSLEQLLQLEKSVHLQIPLYQRLYVWEVEEIKLFIEDVSEAFVSEQQQYFIGNMMFANKSYPDRIVIDLIDGQQRFTTLWLLSIILSKYNERLKSFTFINNEPRLSFTSRDYVNTFFNELRGKIIDILNNENIDLHIRHLSIDNKDELESLIGGITNIYNSIKEVIAKHDWDENSLSDFGNYILANLLMVQTTVPSKNNLNQIFESLNSGGKQLENHQILKSRLLKVLKKSGMPQEEIDILVYKWEASSRMNLYIERSVYSVTEEKWEKVIHDDIWSASNLHSNQTESHFLIKEYVSNDRDPISLLEILKDEHAPAAIKKNRQEESTKSIISFSQFLLHTLRVYNLLNDIEDSVPIDSKNLLKFFNSEDGEFSDAGKISAFINLLFELRFLFDKYVIKWTSEEEDNQESLLINKVYYNKSGTSYSVKREFVESNRQLSLAQSVLYIVQEFKTQYWITPFLYHLYDKYFIQETMETYEDSMKSALIFIEKLDNYFYCQYNESQKMSDLSFNKLGLVFNQKRAGNFDYVSRKLNELKGTFFFRYWFYKTEYLIWKYRDGLKSKIDISDNEYEQWNKFKITFKTSIEHIFPQSKDGFETDEERALYKETEGPILKDYFGNLVLLTVSENSGYGALDVDDKKTKFNLKLDKNTIDSLKSSLIFKLVDQENSELYWKKGVWNFSKAKFHLEEQILPLYQKHLN